LRPEGLSKKDSKKTRDASPERRERQKTTPLAKRTSRAKRREREVVPILTVN